MQKQAIRFISIVIVSLITISFLQNQVQAQQEEPFVDCDEALEPITIKYGEHTNGCAINPATDLDRFSFIGSNGDSVRVIVRSTQNNGFDPLLEIWDPEGTLIENTGCNGEWSGRPACSVILDKSLITTGTYLLAISDGNSDEIGSYTLQLEKIPPVTDPPDIFYNTTVGDSISPVTDVDFLTFEGEENNNIRLTVLSTKSNGFDPHLEIWDPNGIVIENTGCNGEWSGRPACSFSIDKSLTTTGSYLLAISDGNGDEIGSYQINLQCLSFSCGPPDKQPVITSFLPTPAGEGDIVVITGTNFTGATAVTFGDMPASSFIIDSDTQISAVVGTGETGDVCVTNSFGTDCAPDFIFDPRIKLPEIISFSPATASEGDTVVITGTNFTGATAVTFGGDPNSIGSTSATSFTVDTDSQISAIVGSAGSGNVCVIVPNGTPMDMDCKPGFTFVGPLTITNCSPTTAGEGDNVVITGTNFTGTTSVTFGGIPAASFIVDSDTNIMAVVGAGSTGEVCVTASNDTVCKPGFIFATVPIVTSFSPTSAGEGDTVVITGTNLTDVTSVTFGGTPAFDFTVDSGNQISAVVGEGSSGPICVTTINDATGCRDLFVFKDNSPTITGFSPTSAGEGDRVIITGTNFTDATSVTFGGTPAEDFTVDSDTQISAVVGEGSTGAVCVTGINDTGCRIGFVFKDNSPIVNGFTPTSAGEGDTVVITGTNFTDATSVTFGGTFAEDYTVDSDTQISAIVGEGSSGPVCVTTSNGTGCRIGFIFNDNSPTITNCIPTIICEGDTVVITGTNFTDATSVTFGGTPAVTFSVDSDTQIFAVVGEGSPGPVCITTSKDTVCKLVNKFCNIPTVTSFSPTSVSEGDTVVITGTNFTDATSVTFGGTPSNNFTVISDNQISAVVGEGNSGLVCVTTINGTGCRIGFEYIDNSPTVIRFTPTIAREGDTIVITGTNFTDATSVTFGESPFTGQPASSFIVDSDTQISAVVGSGSSGIVCVTTDQGKACESGFNFISPVGPKINSFFPISAREGDTVAITGTDLSDATSVTFGGIESAGITFNSATQISATVGKGRTGKICVITPDGNDCKSGFTFEDPPPVLPEIAKFSPTTATKGTTVVITGNHLANVKSVTFGGTAALTFTVNSDTRIAAVVSEGSSGSVRVEGTGGAASKSGFTYRQCLSPIANFIADKTRGSLPLSVKFTDQSEGNPTNWHWKFGDGGESREMNPSHTYTVEGDYSVTLEVSNECGGDIETKDDFIHVENPPPPGKRFAFACGKEFINGKYGLEMLKLTLGINEQCTLKLINLEPGVPVEISSILKAGLRSAIKIDPARSITDANGELEITITALRKGIDWAAWAVRDDNGKFVFNKNAYDSGLAWGMFVEVK